MLSKQDRISPRTAKDLEQKYAFGEVFGSEDDNSYTGLMKQVNQLKQTLAQYMAYANGKIAELEKDSRAWFYSGVPTLENQPAVEWTTEEIRTKHIGDLYYNNDNGHTYLYRCTETANETETVKTYEWVECKSS